MKYGKINAERKGQEMKKYRAQERNNRRNYKLRKKLEKTKRKKRI